MWARRLGAALAVALFAAGCTGGGSEPPNGPEETTDVGVSPPSTEPTVEDAIDPALARRNPKKPERPPGMDGDDALAAMYAAEYFLDLYGYTVESGDTSLMKELSTENCGFCGNAIKATERIYGEGGWQVGGGIEYENSGVEEDYVGKDSLKVMVDAVQHRGQELDGNGSLVRSTDEKAYYIGVNLVLTDEAWVVDSVSGEDR